MARWFAGQLGAPTDVQRQSWPRIANGEHVLITAPTGSGKTLTAFLWALDRLVCGDLGYGCHARALRFAAQGAQQRYSPQLSRPLRELRETFEAAGEPFPDIRVMTRSGDTPQSDRRRMLRQPPEILITTPESLNLLLSSRGGRTLLPNIATVILDEVHAVVGSKRGVHLITAVDRLVPLAGEFQRIALSATVRPLQTVAEFVGGFEIAATEGEPRFEPRPVSIVQSTETKQYDIQVRFPPTAVDTGQVAGESVWPALVEDFSAIIARNQSTLLFANSRRLCEKLTLFINADAERTLAYAHHGSLSREIREAVEQKLKGGELRAIVATSSLELGIDIGALDEVVLVQSPPSIASGIQRIGRAGHDVGEISRGTLYPTYSHDFIEAAVLAAGVLNQDIEAVQPIDGPLDVLAQILISMVALEAGDLDDVYTELRASYPYRQLSREHFDLVVNMLAGRYAHSRLRELQPKLSVDRLDNSVVARKGAVQDLYFSGGTIPDRGHFQLRVMDSNARIGELDEEFVWERSEGQTFTMGTQNWTIQRITHNDVFVTPAPPKAVELPFWKADGGGRDFHFSERIGQFLERADESLNDQAFAATLQSDHAMDAVAAEQLIDLLQRQQRDTGCRLPHRHHLVLEYVSSGPDGHPGNQVIVHTFWGERVNRPFALALDAAWEERFGQRLEIYPANDCVAVVLPHEVEPDELLSLVSSSRLDALLRRRLESSGYFGARFRECCGRSLLLSRSRMNQRVPLWLTRLRSQKLLDAVRRLDDFPMLIEAWRSCLHDDFDMPALQNLLAEIEAGAISWSLARTRHPSPFASVISWRQVDSYMYMGDEPAASEQSRLRDDLLRDVVFSAELRPALAAHVVGGFVEKRQRLAPGYAPQTARDLVDWVVERMLIPATEWDQLLAAMARDGDDDPLQLVDVAGDRLVRLRDGRGTPVLIAAREQLPDLLAALRRGGSDSFDIEVMGDGEAVVCAEAAAADEDGPETEEAALAELIGRWVQFYGPLSESHMATALGLEPGVLSQALRDLAAAEAVVCGQLLSDDEEEYYCDAENFAVLLRMARADAVPVFEPLPLAQMPLFVASWQGLTVSRDDPEALTRRLEQLLCYEAGAALWEGEFLPARLAGYATSLIDTLMQESPLRWVGRGAEKIALCFDSDLDLMEPARSVDAADGEQSGDSAAELFPDSLGRYDFSTLQRLTALDATELTRRLWQGVWTGRVTNDTFSALRKGIETRFEPPALGTPRLAAASGSGAPGTRPRVTPTETRATGSRTLGGFRSSFSRWKGSLPFAGNWHLLSWPGGGDDALEIEERRKDRVRLLLDRYGLLFRELLHRESRPFRWSELFRSLRLMELSGEVLSGCFFLGIPGPQFISQRAFRQLQRELPENAVYWVNATDPASVCGLQLDELRGSLPKRVPSNHLVYHGSRLVVSSARHGKALDFSVDADCADLPRYFGFLEHLLTRPYQSVRQVLIETIDELPASRSPFLDALRTCFEVRVDYGGATVFKKL